MRKNTRHLLGLRLNVWAASAGHLVLTWLMLTPASGLPEIDLPLSDKGAHIIVYALIFVLWARAFQLPAQTGRRAMLLIVSLTAYGIAIEYIQETFVLNRTGDLADVLANLIGLLAGLLIYSWRQRQMESKN